MTKPGEGASMTTGEAAAYARGRARGLRDGAEAMREAAAREADQLKNGPWDVGRGIRALPLPQESE